MMRRIWCLVLALALVLSAAPAMAVGEHTTTIPVTLTIVHTASNIDVTMPAAMPVSVIDGSVVTASNVEIRNNSGSVDVEVVSVRVEDGAYQVADYDNFPEGSEGLIAMKLNGCGTKSAGELEISKAGFPDIKAGGVLPITYKAKVSDGDDVGDLGAASVVFVLRKASSED